MGSVNCKERITPSRAHVQQSNGIGGTYSTKSSEECNGEFIEKVVCMEHEMQDNEMMQVELAEDAKVLLIKQSGKFSAIGTKCSHYGAILSTGVLGKGHVRCPWHGACFNIYNGDIEDFPGLDSIPCHKVTVEHGQVKVRAKKKDLEKNKRLKDMVKRDPDDERCFVIIGGGPSGAVCAETLRQEGYTGRIMMLCKERNLPYDRVKVSKSMDLPLDKYQFREPEFYDEYSIETLLGVEATSVDTENSEVKCSNGYCIKYDKLYIATGVRPAIPNIPGTNLQNVFTVRYHSDAQAINKLTSPDAHVVCLGSSFIALECAAYLADKVKKVTLIGRSSAPVLQSFGEEVGKRILKLFEEKGVEMIMNSGIKEILGKDGKVNNVVLVDGVKKRCDICILGVGSKSNTEFLQCSNIPLNPDGSTNADMHLMTNVPNVYVGGDIAHAPVFPIANQRATIGHYQLAQYHGRIAGMNMAGNIQELRAVPFFWTVLFGKSFRYCGYGTPAEVRIEGDLENLKFVAMYFDVYGNVIAMASCLRDPVVAQFAELLRQGWRLHKNDLEKDPFGWTKWLLQA